MTDHPSKSWPSLETESLLNEIFLTGVKSCHNKSQEARSEFFFLLFVAFAIIWTNFRGWLLACHDDRISNVNKRENWNPMKLWSRDGSRDGSCQHWHKLHPFSVSPSPMSLDHFKLWYLFVRGRMKGLSPPNDITIIESDVFVDALQAMMVGSMSTRNKRERIIEVRWCNSSSKPPRSYGR